MNLSQRLDLLAFGSIRMASSLVSFFGTFWLVAQGQAEIYGQYLTLFSLVSLISIGLRLGVDHSLLKVQRRALRADLARDPRPRLLRGWAGPWAAILAVSVAVWLAGLPAGLIAAQACLSAGLLILGRFLRACQRPRASALFDQSFMHLFGMGLLLVGLPPTEAFGYGLLIWLAMGLGVFAANLGRPMLGAILTAQPWLAAKPGRLVSISVTYAIDGGFMNGINLLIAGLYGPVALALYNTLMKLNFVSEQAQEFQRSFRLGSLPGSEAAGRHDPREMAVAPRGLKGRIKAFLARLDGPRRAPGSGPAEIALFSAVAAAGNLAIMLVLLDHPFEAMPAWAFYLLLTAAQTASLAAGPAIFAIWLYRSVGLANLMRGIWVTTFALTIALGPAQPEIWALSNMVLLAILRFAALRAWMSREPASVR